MKKQSLLERRKAVETKFSELQKQQSETNEEMIRLQGEYRSLTVLIDEESNDANIIKVEE